MSEVKRTFFKSFWGKKLEGEHGVWFGGEWEEREWFVWLISLIWQDKEIKEAVLGKMWANPWEALPSEAWSTGEPWSTTCNKGDGCALLAENLSWLPKDRSTKTPRKRVFQKVHCVCIHPVRMLQHYIGRWSSSREFKKSPSCGAQASRGRLQVTRYWPSTVSWEFELTAQGQLLKKSLVWSTCKPRSTVCDKELAECCWLRIWANCPRTAPQKLPHMERERVCGKSELRSTACDKGVGECFLILKFLILNFFFN